MQLLKSLALALFAGIAAAAPVIEEQDGPAVEVIEERQAGPSGHEVEILGVPVPNGSGCPLGSVSGALSTDKTTLTLLYSTFTAQTGPGIPPADSRKFCQIPIKVKYPQGWQFSVFKADYRGYASLPKKGVKGTCKATYYFGGDSKQVSTSHTLPNPYNDNYLFTDKIGVTSLIWSPCGYETILNIKTEIALTPLSPPVHALLTTDSHDFKFHQIHHLQWRKCKK